MVQILTRTEIGMIRDGLGLTEKEFAKTLGINLETFRQLIDGAASLSEAERGSLCEKIVALPQRWMRN